MPIEMKLNGKLTRKQAGFTAEIVKQIKSGSNKINGTQAALKHYNTTDPHTASMIATKNMKNGAIRDVVDAALREQGLDVSTLLGEAKTLAAARVEKVSADVKLRSIVELLKLHGAYPDRKSAHLNVSLKGKLKDLSFQDAKKKLQELNGESTIFIDEAE